MAKNLRQKYKEAKQQLQILKLKVFAAEVNRICSTKRLPIIKIGTQKSVDYREMENMREAVIRDLAFDLANHMVKEDMLNIEEIYDPYTGRVYVNMQVNIVNEYGDA